MATKPAKPAKAEAEKAKPPAKNTKAAAKPGNDETLPSKEEAPAKASPGSKKPNAGLAKPVQPSKELAAIIGKEAMPRTEVISKVWDYIRKNELQNPADKRKIMADKKLQAVFGKDETTMFEMNKLLSAHLT